MPNTLPAILTADASAAAASAAEVLVACSDLGEAGEIWRLALDSQRGRGQFKNYYWIFYIISRFDFSIFRLPARIIPFAQGETETGSARPNDAGAEFQLTNPS